MEKKTVDKLILSLRDQASDLLAATQLLTPLVREKGEKRDVMTLGVMNQSLFRLVRTLNHLDLCQTADPVLRPAVVDLSELFRDLSRQVESVATGLGIDFTWEVERENFLTMADADLIRLAILSLVGNALQAAGRGGKVTLRFSSNKSGCRVSVQDNGPGLKEEGAEPNLMCKTWNGIGLSLETVRRVAALHGGTLLLEQGEETGVLAVLALPVQRPEGDGTVRTAPMPYDWTGGFSPLLVELSTLLPPEWYLPDDLE